MSVIQPWRKLEQLSRLRRFNEPVSRKKHILALVAPMHPLALLAFSCLVVVSILVTFSGGIGLGSHQFQLLVGVDLFAIVVEVEAGEAQETGEFLIETLALPRVLLRSWCRLGEAKAAG